MFSIAALCCLGFLGSALGDEYTNNDSVKLLQAYVQINTTSNNNLTKAVEFWKTLACAEGLEISVNEFTSGFPVLVIKLPGSDSSLSSLMLNSHMDVVPADETDGWTYPPFSGYLDDSGVIWGRGTQDMKSVGLQYFEALRRIRANNVTLLRDVYMTLMPDEEIGGENGIVPFLASDVFKSMNVGLGMDEGTSYNLSISPVFYQEKVPWQIQVDCYGDVSHSSTFPASNQTAAGRCAKVISRMYQFREEEYVKYTNSNGVFSAGVYTAVNMNKLSGGTANNVIAGHVSLEFDLRLNVTLNATAFDAQLREWIEDDNVTMTYILKSPQSPATLISDSNPYWTVFKNVTSSLGLQVLPLVSPGATDSRYVRIAGIPVFSFSPMPNTPLLLHSVNERLNASTYLRGIDIYQALITGFANIAGNQTSASPSAYIVTTAPV